MAPGVRLDAGVPGNEVFGTAAGGIDILQAVSDFETALRNNDLTGIQLAVDAMDVAQAQVNSARGVLGAQHNGFDVATAVIERSKLQSAERREDLIAVDPAESYLDLNRAQQALQTAGQIAGQIPLPGLVTGG